MDERHAEEHVEAPVNSIISGTVVQEHAELIQQIAANETRAIPIYTGTRNRKIYLVREAQQGPQRAEKPSSKERVDSETSHRMKRMTKEEILEQACTQKCGYGVLDMLVDLHGREDQKLAIQLSNQGKKLQVSSA